MLMGTLSRLLWGVQTEREEGESQWSRVEGTALVQVSDHGGWTPEAEAGLLVFFQFLFAISNNVAMSASFSFFFLH